MQIQRSLYRELAAVLAKVLPNAWPHLELLAARFECERPANQRHVMSAQMRTPGAAVGAGVFTDAHPAAQPSGRHGGQHLLLRGAALGGAEPQPAESGGASPSPPVSHSLARNIVLKSST